MARRAVRRCSDAPSSGGLARGAVVMEERVALLRRQTGRHHTMVGWLGTGLHRLHRPRVGVRRDGGRSCRRRHHRILVLPGCLRRPGHPVVGDELAFTLIGVLAVVATGLALSARILVGILLFLTAWVGAVRGGRRSGAVALLLAPRSTWRHRCGLFRRRWRYLEQVVAAHHLLHWPHVGFSRLMSADESGPLALG